VGFGAFDQLTFDLFELVSAQFRQPSGAAYAIPPRPTPCGTRRRRSVGLPHHNQCTVHADRGAP
jgi:hypothetical protein